MRRQKISPVFNFVSSGKPLADYTLTLTKPGDDPSSQAEDFRARLTQWLRLQGDDAKGNAEAPAVADARITLRCTEETLGRIERQFAGDILKIDPPAQHMRGTIFPPKVDPWDVSRW